jgi:hypothetical protein
MNIGKWCYSRYEDADFLDVETRDDAIAEGAAEARDQDAESFFIAPTVPPDLNKIVDVDSGSILDRIIENDYGCMPENGRWLDDVSAEQTVELDALLEGVIVSWIRRHGHEPDWFGVGQVEEIRVADCPT